MSDKIFKLIYQRGLSDEKQQEIVGLIVSASKADVEYKVSPSSSVFNCLLYLNLASLQAFIFFSTHLGLGCAWRHLPSLCCISWICFHPHRAAEEGGGHQWPRQICKYGFIEFHVFGVECCCVGGVG